MKFLPLLQPRSLILAAFVAGTPITIGVLATLTGLAATPAVAVDVIDFGQKWVVSVDEARALIANGALVLDARNADLKSTSPVPNARPIRWQDLSNTSGRISTDNAALSLRLQALGVDAGRPIVVLADPFQGLGEDAEIVWALRSLGHDRVVMVDGGLPALLVAGVPYIQPPIGQGSFIVDHRDDWSIDANATSRDLVRLKGRAMSELLADDGRLKPRPEIAAWLAAKGIDHDTALATDSAWLTTVLINAGYHARQVVGATEYALTAAN
jgi:thiosulfate/3-mercaptopyruvate sulfurtransferase